MKYYIQLAIVSLVIGGCSTPRLPLGELPESLPTFDVKINEGNAFDGYLFVRKRFSPGAQIMIDQSGNVVWYLLSDTALFRPSTPYETSFVALHSDREAYEISYKGDTLNQWIYDKQGGFNSPLHHEIVKDSEHNLVALSYKHIPFDLSTQGGTVDDSLRIDGVVKLSPDGERLWSWFLDEHVDPNVEPEAASKNINGHSNSLLIDTDGHYLISWKNFNQVWKINSTDGSILWKYGIREELPEEEWITGQHAVHINLNGDYMVLDNGTKVTRAFGFKRNSNETFTNTLTIELPDSLYSLKQGSVYQFAEDRFLFCSSQTKTLIVTNSPGDILWLATSKEPFYRANYLPKEIFDH